MEPGRRRWKERLGAALLGFLCVFVLLEVALRLLGIACEQRNASASAKGSGAGRTILCLGDSFTWGAGAIPSMSWPRQLEQLLNRDGGLPCTVVNRGLAGQNTARLLQNLQANLDSVRPDLVILCAGAANYWDSYGLREESTAWGWSIPTVLRDALYRVRVFRLAKLMVLAVGDAHEKAEKARRIARLEAARKAHQARLEREITAEQAKRSRECWSKGRELWQARRLEEAVALFREGIAANPYLADNYTGIAECCQLQNHPAEAEEWCLKALEADPGALDPYSTMIWVKRCQERPDQALDWALKAREVAPGDAGLMCQQALCLASLQRYDEGISLISQAIAAAPERRVDFLPDRARIHELQGDLALAKQDLEEVLRQQPGHGRSLVALGALLCRQGELRQALAVYEKCTDAGSRVRALMGQGECHGKLGEPEESLRCYQEAARLDPGEAGEFLAEAYRAMGCEDEAQAWFRKAMEANPNRAREIQLKALRPPGRLRPPLGSRGGPRRVAAGTSSLTPVEEWIRADLKEAVAICRRAGIPVILHSYPAQTVPKALLARIAAECEVPFVDHQAVFSAQADPMAYFAPDAHCNEAGYGLMAQDLHPQVVEMLKSPR